MEGIDAKYICRLWTNTQPDSIPPSVSGPWCLQVCQDIATARSSFAEQHELDTKEARWRPELRRVWARGRCGSGRQARGTAARNAGQFAAFLNTGD
jgi:hypothetical protein